MLYGEQIVWLMERCFCLSINELNGIECLSLTVEALVSVVLRDMSELQLRFFDHICLHLSIDGFSAFTV